MIWSTLRVVPIGLHTAGAWKTSSVRIFRNARVSSAVLQLISSSRNLLSTVSADEIRSALWFERLYTRLGLPFWAGAPLVGFLPFLVSTFALFVLAGLLGTFMTGLIFIMPFFFILNMYAQAAARYVVRRVEVLVDYSEAIGQRGTGVQLLPSLSGLRGPAVVTTLVLAIILPLFNASLGRQGTFYQYILVGVLPWICFGLFFGTFIWVLSYSMYTLYHIGKLPLKLKHFTEDRTLGLRPFGSASLRLTGIYIVGVGLFVIPNTHFRDL